MGFFVLIQLGDFLLKLSMDSASTGNKVISLTEFRSANTRDKCYVAIENKVYDVTEFLSQHPGGHAVLLQGGGKNVTEDFNTIRHSANAKELAESMRIGVLQDQEFTTARGDAPSSAITSTSSVRDTPVDSKDK
jgi:cytochrome b involved in lipid metabolism